jgi:hypothetical protein
MSQAPCATHQARSAASSAGASIVPHGLLGLATMTPRSGPPAATAASSIAHVGWNAVLASTGSSTGCTPAASRMEL